MNEIIRNIYERRAVRKYKDVAVHRDVLEQLLDAGRMAPSAMNRQPWKFYVLTDAGKIRTFSKEIAGIAVRELKHVSLKDAARLTLSVFHFSKMIDFLKTEDHIFYSAPVVILITTLRNAEWAALDVGMCSQNIMLAASSLGLDTCPVGFAKFIMQTKDYFSLNIPAEEQVQLAIVAGYGDEHPAVHERIENNAVFY